MAELISALVALDAGVDRESIHDALPVTGDIHVVGVVDGLDESWKVLQEARADLLVIACAGYSERALFLIDAAIKQKPERPVIVLSEGSPNGFVRRVFEAGADDIVALTDDPDALLFAVQKAIARKHGASVGGTSVSSPMICVLGPKGGTGKTLTACNLAVALADAQHRVALVDLDLQFGDVGLALGLSPEKTVADLARAGGTIDGEKLDDYLVTHASGARVLLAPTRPDHAALVSIEFLRDLYAALRANFDYVIVDTPPGFTPEVIASIDSSSHICMVGMLDSLSLKNTKLGLETLDLMGYDAERVIVVLNRADTRVGIEPDDVLAIMGRKPEVLVPSDRDIPRAVNEAQPIVHAKERSEAAKAFRRLAEMYAHGAEQARPAPVAPPAEAPAPNGRRPLLKLGRKT
jgi:pilus assembly protein CpaE